MMICSCFSWGAVLGFSTANAVVVSITAKSWDKNESIKVPWPRWFCFGGKDGFWGSKKPMFFEVKIWNHPRENNQIIWKYKCFSFDVCRFRIDPFSFQRSNGGRFEGRFVGSWDFSLWKLEGELVELQDGANIAGLAGHLFIEQQHVFK